MKVSLAYAFANGIVPKTEALENFVEETFSVLIEGLGIEDTGFDNWLQRESFSSDEPPSSLLNPDFVDLVKPDDGSVFFLFQNMCPPQLGLGYQNAQGQGATRVTYSECPIEARTKALGLLSIC